MAMANSGGSIFVGLGIVISSAEFVTMNQKPEVVAPGRKRKIVGRLLRIFDRTKAIQFSHSALVFCHVSVP
jgi:hypothetical protein